jgi:hypothetical protein
MKLKQRLQPFLNSAQEQKESLETDKELEELKVP